MNHLFTTLRSLRPHVMHGGPSAGAPAHGTVPSRAFPGSTGNSSEVERSGMTRDCDPPWVTCSQSLQPQHVELDVDVPDVKRALERAAEVICGAHGLDPAPVFRALWRREQIGSTAIGHGVALPHARVSGIAEPLMLFMRPKYAIDFDAPDGRLVTRIWVILVPADGSADDHLKLLASIAEACSDEGLRTHLDSASTADDVVRALRDWTKRHVA